MMLFAPTIGKADCAAPLPCHCRLFLCPFLAADALDHLQEIVEISQIEVDAGEADIRDAVQRQQAIHHHVADRFGGHFEPSLLDQLLLDVIYQPLDLANRQRAFVAGFADVAHQFLAIERLAAAISLDHQRSMADLDPLHSVEAPLAFATPPPPLNALRGIACFEHMRIFRATKWTMHTIT
jgi:hypothetical protein